MKHLLNQIIPIILGSTSCFFLFSCVTISKKNIDQKSIKRTVKEIKALETSPAISQENIKTPEEKPRWLTLKNDTELPTDQQLSEGGGNSINTKNSQLNNESSPTTSVKPPLVEEE